MQRRWKIVLACAAAPSLATIVAPHVLAQSNLWQMGKSSRMRAASGHVPTVEIDLGIIAPIWRQGDSVAKAKAIQRLSSELKSNKGQCNIIITWAPNANPDEMPGIVSYYAPVQMLEYGPEVLGETYRYENVAPTQLHALAAQHGSDFHKLTALGCEESIYNND